MDFSEYKYKLEMHCHSKPVSFCARCTVQEVAERYKALGYDGIVLTNHFNKSDCERRGEGLEKFVEGYIKDYRDLKEECEKLGIRVYLGMEIKFSNVNANEYLVYGVDEDDVRKAADFLDERLRNFTKALKMMLILYIRRTRSDRIWYPCRWIFWTVTRCLICIRGITVRRDLPQSMRRSLKAL